jgi:hypothetical protein
MDTPNGTIGQVTATIVDANGARSTATCALMDFEQSEHGAMLGRRVIPWHRIERVAWGLPPRDPDAEESLAKVRVLVDDGSPGGEEIVVSAERFEMLDWAIGLLVDDRVDAMLGTVDQRRVLVPWHSVREYERQVTGSEVLDGVMPSRPDALA